MTDATTEVESPKTVQVTFVGGPMDGYRPTVLQGAYGDPFEYQTGDGKTTTYRLTATNTYTADE